MSQLSPPLIAGPQQFDEIVAAAYVALVDERSGSRAGHDACHVARKASTGMILVPLPGRAINNEAESIQPEAASRGADVLLQAALQLTDTAD